MGKADYSEVALKIKALWTLTGPEIAKETLETYIKTFEGGKTIE